MEVAPVNPSSEKEARKVFRRATSSRLVFDEALGDLSPLAAFRDDVSPCRRDVVRKFLFHFGVESQSLKAAAKVAINDLMKIHEQCSSKLNSHKTPYNLEQDLKNLHRRIKYENWKWTF